MRLHDLPVSEINPTVLESLKDESVIEDKWLDYKEDFPHKKDKDIKRDFLADVVAMANTEGGDILVGVKEQRDAENRPTGIPEEIVGVQIDNWDAVRREWDQSIADSIEPRLQGVQIEPFYIGANRAVILFRVPASLQAPHMITSRPCFYTRGPGRSDPMDIDTIRYAFLKSASLRERANTFRLERVRAVLDGLAPVNLVKGAMVFLHIVPLGTQPFSINWGDDHVREKAWTVRPLLKGMVNDQRLNFDGLVNSYVYEKGLFLSYVQIFRDGSMEFCDAGLLLSPDIKTLVIEEVQFEEAVINALHSSLRLYEQLNISLPVVTFLSLTGVKGYVVVRGSEHRRYPIDRDQLFPPGQLIEERGQKAEHVLQPIFDSICNASGLEKSPFYDEDGNWSKKMRR
jgi:hypothetical protein